MKNGQSRKYRLSVLRCWNISSLLASRPFHTSHTQKAMPIAAPRISRIPAAILPHCPHFLAQQEQQYRYAQVRPAALGNAEKKEHTPRECRRSPRPVATRRTRRTRSGVPPRRRRAASAPVEQWRRCIAGRLPERFATSRRVCSSAIIGEGRTTLPNSLDCDSACVVTS